MQACFSIINVFRNQLNDVAPILQIENEFYEQVHIVFQWYIHYFPDNKFEAETVKLLTYALDTFVSFFSLLVREYGAQMCIRLFKNNLI